MRLFRHFFLILTIFSVVACRQSPSKETEIKGTSKPNKILVSGSGKLIPINFSDKNYIDLENYAVDTLTADGWSIKYFVKDDSTRYKDLYLVCSKGDNKVIKRLEDVLEFRRYFIPEFVAETKHNIYFTHGCATECAALLVFDKESKQQFIDYLEVVKYNIMLGQIIYVTDRTYQNEEKVYELRLADVERRKIHTLLFNGICDGYYKPACVDTVIFSRNKVSVTVSLRKSIEDTSQTKQTKTVRL